MIVGREPELAALDAFLDAVANGPVGLLLEGEPGIGKTALWGHGVEAARRRGHRVLSCRPTGSDAQLSFAGLGDLLVDASPFVEPLPDPQREAVEVALLRRPRAGRAPDPRAAAVATLAVLRAMAAETPTVVAIDDVPWLDPPTERVLTFAARRLADDHLGFLLGRPPADEAPLRLGDALPAERWTVVHVAALDAHHLATIVRERTGLALSAPESARLAELSGGNPFYALEIARAKARGDEGVTGQRMPIPKSLREDLVSARIGAVTAEARDTLLLAASMARPTVAAMRLAIPDSALEAGLQESIDAGIIEVLGLDVRFAHPLYRSAIYADASRRRRHEMHRRLAAAVTDPEERARHLALAADGPDSETADRVEEAAASARARGAPEIASELLEHAIRLTPLDDRMASRRRLLQVASDRLSAGDAAGARTRAQDALRTSELGIEQAEALRRIGEIEFVRGSLGEARATLDEALARAGDDPRMAAEIHLELARVAIRAGEMGAAERNTAAALELAEREDDPALTFAVMTTTAEVDVLLARPSSSLADALNTERSERPPVAGSPELVAARAEAFAGELDRAQERLERLLVVAREQGDEPGRLAVTTRLAEVQIRAGSWRRAEELATEAHELALDLGVGDRIQLALMAHAAAGLGRIDECRRLAADALADAGGDRSAQLWALSALGSLELSLLRFAEAVRDLRQAGGLLAETGIEDPCAFPFLADEADALVAVGEGATADSRIAALEASGERFDRDLVRAQAARCGGLLAAANGDLPAAVRALEEAVAIAERVGLPMELGRSLLALGVVRRRDRQKRPAREALERAFEAFESMGASVWAERVREEIDRIGGRRASIGELTDAETRVARLAAAGRSNREIAQTLSMSVRTVEGHLSHVYAKLELRSRTELAIFLQPAD